MMGPQLGRIALAAGGAVSLDQQQATADQDGSYGELMDLIDHILEQSDPDRSGAPDEHRPPKRNGKRRPGPAGRRRPQ